MNRISIRLAMVLVCGLIATGAQANLPADGVNVPRFEENPFAYLFDRDYRSERRDGPYAYLLERDVTPKVDPDDDRGPYAYLFDRGRDDRG